MILVGKIVLGIRYMASKYEEKVEQLLKSNSYHYKKEISFIGLYGKGKNFLRYDFAIYENDKLTYLIEVDGEYHFKPIRGKLAFQRQKALDERKNSYCLINHIKLIRIPFWEINNLTIEKIFKTPDFVVKNKYHNLMLIEKLKF